MTDELAVEANGLEKSYGAVKVLAGVDLRVERGSVFALLGPNGAGKTTTVRILSTLIRADAGQARVAASTSSASGAGCVAASASPASTRPSTHCRPARRTWP
jgi:ABC-type multidrug transport system ATPase subunit